MKNLTLTLILIVISFCSIGQSRLHSLELNNTTDKKLFIVKTSYYTDTTKTNIDEFLCAKCKSSSSTDIYKQYIRLDIFALDSSTFDTAFSTTINLIDFDSTKLVIDIIYNQKSHLPTLHPSERLNIHADNRDIILKTADKIEVKTGDNLIIKGVIQSYSNEDLTIKSKNSTLTVPFSNLKYIRLCRPRIDISPSFSIGNKCSFFSIDTNQTRRVKEKQVKYPSGYLQWSWR